MEKSNLWLGFGFDVIGLFAGSYFRHVDGNLVRILSFDESRALDSLWDSSHMYRFGEIE